MYSENTEIIFLAFKIYKYILNLNISKARNITDVYNRLHEYLDIDKYIHTHKKPRV